VPVSPEGRMHKLRFAGAAFAGARKK